MNENNLHLRREYCLGIAPKIDALHCKDMHLVASDKLTKLFAQNIIWVGGNMVKLVHRDQAVVERLNAEALHREAEGGMGADKHLVITFKERADAVDIAAIIAVCVAQVPFRGHCPFGTEHEKPGRAH